MPFSLPRRMDITTWASIWTPTEQTCGGDGASATAPPDWVTTARGTNDDGDWLMSDCILSWTATNCLVLGFAVVGGYVPSRRKVVADASERRGSMDSANTWPRVGYVHVDISTACLALVEKDPADDDVTTLYFLFVLLNNANGLRLARVASKDHRLQV